jgi:hypothetical protein
MRDGRDEEVRRISCSAPRWSSSGGTGTADTSLDDLFRATRLNRSSVYSSFGDKDSLYLRCLNATPSAMEKGMTRRFPPVRPGTAAGVTVVLRGHPPTHRRTRHAGRMSGLYNSCPRRTRVRRASPSSSVPSSSTPRVKCRWDASRPLTPRPRLSDQRRFRPPHPGPRRRRGNPTELTNPTMANPAEPISGQICWPSRGSSTGDQRAHQLAPDGQNLLAIDNR